MASFTATVPRNSDGFFSGDQLYHVAGCSEAKEDREHEKSRPGER